MLLPYHFVQKFVDNTGMYRLVSGSLFILATLSILFGFTGLIAYSGASQMLSLTIALTTALVLNWVIARVFHIPSNHESAVITALILFFLALPESSILENWPLVAAVSIAIVSKYLFVYKKQHFMNPAAVGAAALSMTGIYSFSWWVANPVLFVPLLITGILIVMKVRKWVPVLGLVGVGLLIYVAEAMSYGDALMASITTFFMSWPTLFLAFFMLTEPFTMPARKDAQFLYGGIVGFLSNSSMLTNFIVITPEFALVVANVLMVPWRLRQKLFLVLQEKRTIAKDTYEFVFKKPSGFSFEAGQYLEWMLPHKNSDSKGVRRYFTIASSPTEADVKVAMKITEKRSSYKQALLQMDTEQYVTASQLAGDFLLPKNTQTKLGFIAGGIGITPFRSLTKYMIDSDTRHDTVLYYCNNLHEEIAYADFFADAERVFQFKCIHVIANETVSAPIESGFITLEMLKRRTPDYLERVWYVSGPPGMVNAYGALLRKAGIPHKHIKKDFFPGAV